MKREKKKDDWKPRAPKPRFPFGVGVITEREWRAHLRGEKVPKEWFE